MKNIYIFIVILLTISLTQQSYAIVKGNFALSITTGNYFYVDHNNCTSGGGPRAAYLGVRIRNASGVSQTNISLEFVKYTDSSRYFLVGGQAIGQSASLLANNANDTFFWYSTYPCFSSGTGYPTNVIFRVKDTDDGTSYLDTLTGLSTEEQISSNGGGLVGTATVTRQDPVGGLFSFRCDYNYPKLVAGDKAYMQPTTNLSFDAASFQLESAVITSSTANSASCIPVGNCPMNYNVTGTCNSFEISVEYNFRIKNNQSTTAYPYNSATSGEAGLKYVITEVPVSLYPSSTLPVELTAYKAVVDNKSVVNTWTTASEYNNDFFSVERSKDALSFEKIGEVDGAGNSAAIRNYSFTDKNPYAGISYYRLCQTDFDKHKTYSNIVSVNIEDDFYAKPDVRVYPNPSTGLFTIAFDDFNTEDVSIQVYDVTGSMVLDRNVQINENDRIQVNLNTVMKGEYYIFYTTDNFSRFKKFLVQ